MTHRRSTVSCPGCSTVTSTCVSVRGTRFPRLLTADAALCGHVQACEYLLEKGARCQPDTWDGERCHYAALSDRIRTLLRRFEAVNRQRGPLFAFTFRAFNNPATFADVRLVLPLESTVLYVHRAILARSPYFRRCFEPGGRWEGRVEVRLTDPRLRAAPLRAVVGFLYTERLICAGGDIPGKQRWL